MSWRLAHGLEKLRQQVNAKWPDRSKDSDGSIGDEHHSARLSDHNPDAAGIVHAIDITHDPAHGFDSYAFADLLLKKQDRRLKYVISNRRIGSGPAGPGAGAWRKYTGINPHDHHCHVSIMSGPPADATDPWNIDGPDPVFVPPPPTLREGAHGQQVVTLQTALNARGTKLDVNGIFDNAVVSAVKGFQAAHGLVVDAVVGPQTWKELA